MSGDYSSALRLTWVMVVVVFVATATDNVPWICVRLCSCELDKTTGLYTGNCSHRGLTEVPHNLPSNFIQLDLSYNNIPCILANQFVNLTFLKTLDLSSNFISIMDQAAFIGLNSLKQLWLSGNKLILRQEMRPFEPLIFSPLHNLESLFLNNNSLECSSGCGYPDTALSYINTLKLLNIDGLRDFDFGPGFTNLTHLETLIVGHDQGNCQLNVITNTTFLHLQMANLTFLHLLYCGTHTIHPEGFRPLRKIHTLELRWPTITFSALKTGMTGLSHSPIKVLILTHTQFSGTEFILPGRTFEDLVNTTLTQLTFIQSGLVAIEKNFLLNLPKSLKVLDMSHNGILTGKQWWLYPIIKLSNLTVFNISNQGKKMGERRSGNSPEDTSLIKISSINEDKHTKVHTNNNITMLSDMDSPILGAPVNLRYLYVQNCHLAIGNIPALNFSKNNLIYADLSDNTLQLKGPFYGLHKLEHFDVTRGKSSILNKNFFVDMPNLKKLLMKENNLNILSKDKDGVSFSKLNKLRYLDLSKNGIEQLPKLIFREQYQLETLLLNSNYLTDWITSIGHMLNLTFLNLSQNRLSTLSDSARQDLEKVMKKPDLKINMMNNPLLCSCNDIEFLKWLNRKNKFFVDIHKYTCALPDGTNTTLNKIPVTLNHLETLCNSSKTLIGAAVSLGLLIGCLVLTAFIYRHRWQVRYYKNKLALRLQLYQPLVQENEDLMYIAFLSYEESLHHFIIGKVYPVLEQEYGLKLCIHTRDFVPGHPVAYNIYRAVHSSKKTVAFITEQYFTSEWCVYEFKMAYLECVHTGKQFLVLALMEPVDITKQTDDIKQIFKYVTYLDYKSMNEPDFFRKLVAILQD